MAPIYITISPKETGRNIQQLMKLRGLKVRDLQEACGFEQPQAVYKWIHGQSLPSIDNLLVLSKLFNSTVESILVTSGNALSSFWVKYNTFPNTVPVENAEISEAILCINEILKTKTVSHF